MRKVYYYQPNIVRHEIVVTNWQKICQQGDLPCKKRIFLDPKEYYFSGCAGELSFFINNYTGDFSELVIVIGKIEDDFIKGTLQVELMMIVLCYPEVNLIFEDNISIIPDQIEDEEGNIFQLGTTEKELLCKSNEDDFSFLEFLSRSNNLFDASNLRGVFRKWKQETLKVHNNFSQLQARRSKSLALVIDEESEQSLLNSYVLYANGYRSLPITNSQQLERIKQNSVNYDIIIRDFDLQFPDEKHEVIDNVNTVDLVRGYKYDSQQIWRVTLGDSNKFWKKSDYDEGKVFVITQGYENLKVCPQLLRIKVDKELEMPGLVKPLCGVYYSIQQLGIIKDSFVKARNEFRKPDRSRKKHDHSSPLDLYDYASVMFKRAKYYYSTGRFILAAVVSQEALELLNCFHVALSVQVYHLHAVAENAIAMGVIGGKEEELAKDCEIRVRIIKEDVKRIMSGTDQDSSNVLNQIFSDCRIACKEKEHFKAEDVFIKEMAHLNDGFSLFSNKLIDKTLNKLNSYE